MAMDSKEAVVGMVDRRTGVINNKVRISILCIYRIRVDRAQQRPSMRSLDHSVSMSTFADSHDLQATRSNSFSNNNNTRALHSINSNSSSNSRNAEE